MNLTAARQLIEEYLRKNTNQPEIEAYTVPGTSDVVLVAIARVPAQKQERAIKSLNESIRSLTPSASGQRCPTCNGTGRIS